MAFDPSPAELSAFETMTDVFGFLEMEADLVDAVVAAAGAKTMTLRTWGRIPATRFAAMIPQLQIDDTEGPRGLTPIEEGQVGDLGRILDMLAQRPSSAIGSGGGAGPAPRGGVAAGSPPGTGAPLPHPGPLARYCHRSDPRACTEPQAGETPQGRLHAGKCTRAGRPPPHIHANPAGRHEAPT